jgi:spore coat protein U-like protein
LLSASDQTGMTDTFLLRQGNNTIPFEVCAYDSQGTCVILKNGNVTEVPVDDSGTERIYGLIQRGATQQYQLGNYSDDITVTLSF